MVKEDKEALATSEELPKALKDKILRRCRDNEMDPFALSLLTDILDNLGDEDAFMSSRRSKLPERVMEGIKRRLEQDV